MDKTLLFIINPHSGKGEIKSKALGIIDTFVKSGFLVTVYTTQGSGEAAKIVSEIGSRFDRIVSCGGDGTVNEVLNGVMKLEKRPPLGIIPAGTTNDYSYSLSIPFNMYKAAEVAASDRLFNIDVGRFNDRYFNYVAAFGLFTEVTYETPQDYKNILGSVAYVLEGAKRLSSIKSRHVRVEYDGGVYEDDVILALFANTISVAGIRTAFSEAKLDDGLLEIALFKLPKTLADVQTIIHILLNFEQAKDVRSDFMRVVTTTKAHITCESPISWTVDGENGGAFTDVHIENISKTVNVVTGPME